MNCTSSLNIGDILQKWHGTYLNIDCKFTGRELIVEQPTNSKIEVNQEGCKEGGLAFDQGELLKSGKLADFTIRAGNDEFACHKLILIYRSPVFERMLSVDMVESKTGEVTITDISPENVADMLSYIYTDQVDHLDDKAGAYIYFLDIPDGESFGK